MAILAVSWQFPGTFLELSISGSYGLVLGRRSGRRGSGIDLRLWKSSLRGYRARILHLHNKRFALRTHWLDYGWMSHDASRVAKVAANLGERAGKPIEQGRWR